MVTFLLAVSSGLPSTSIVVSTQCIPIWSCSWCASLMPILFITPTMCCHNPIHHSDYNQRLLMWHCISTPMMHLPIDLPNCSHCRTTPSGHTEPCGKPFPCSSNNTPNQIVCNCTGKARAKDCKRFNGQTYARSQLPNSGLK